MRVCNRFLKKVAEILGFAFCVGDGDGSVLLSGLRWISEGGEYC